MSQLINANHAANMAKTYKEIAEAVKIGIISLDSCGHRTNITKERFIERYENILEMANGKNDGKWSNKHNDPIEQVNSSMREFYQRILDSKADPYDPRKTVGGLLGPGLDGEYCFECGGKFRFMFDGDNKICLRQCSDKNGYVLTDRCEFEHRRPMYGQIQITSPLMFLNFTKTQDCPENKEFAEEWSLNCIKGRTNILRYKWETQNIAYGQLTNCSYGIFVHPSRESIIIGNPHIADNIIDNMPEDEWDDSKYDELYKQYSSIENHDLVGTICCDMWRWEAVDTNTLNKLFDNDYSEKISNQQHKLEVPYGTWKFSHYFDTQTSMNKHIWAKLERYSSKKT